MLDLNQYTDLVNWMKMPGFFSVEEAVALQNLVKHLPSAAQVVELGTYQGKSAVAIASVLPEKGCLHCVDNFQGMVLRHGQKKPPIKDVVKNNLEALSRHLTTFHVHNKVRIIVSNTINAAQHFPDQSIDLLHIDAGHSYENVKNDLKTWYPKLKISGYLICDDVEEKWPGVVQAVRESKLAGHFIAPSLWAHRKESADVSL